jgi:hypothetical protein
MHKEQGIPEIRAYFPGSSQWQALISGMRSSKNLARSLHLQKIYDHKQG